MYREIQAEIGYSPREVNELDSLDFYEKSYQILSYLEPILPEKVGLISSFYSNGEAIIPVSIQADGRPYEYGAHSVVLDGRSVFADSADETLLWQHTETNGSGVGQTTTVMQMGCDLTGLQFATKRHYNFQGLLVKTEENLSSEIIEREQNFIISCVESDDCQNAFNTAFFNRQNALDKIQGIDDEIKRLEDPKEKPEVIERITKVLNVGDHKVRAEANTDYLMRQRDILEKSLKRMGLSALTPREK